MCFLGMDFQEFGYVGKTTDYLTANINKFAIGSIHPSKATRQDVGIGITHLHDMWFCSQQKDSFLVLLFPCSFWISWAKINFQTYVYIYIYTCVHHVFVLRLVKVQVRQVRRRLDFFVSAYKRPSKGWPFPESRRSTVSSPLAPKNAPHSVVSSRFGMSLASLGGVWNHIPEALFAAGNERCFGRKVFVFAKMTCKTIWTTDIWDDIWSYIDVA